MARNWKECNKRHPCDICGNARWCSYTTDGGMRKCRRLLEGVVTRSDMLGDYSLYPAEGSTPTQYVREEPPEPPCASKAEISHLLHRMLSVLKLSDSHRENLRSRGLSDEWIDVAGYRSYRSSEYKDILRELWPEYGWNLLHYPGFYKTSESKIAMSCMDGILIPVRDSEGEIQALRIRLDEPMDGTKYIWMSSASRGGPSSKSPCHVALGSMKDGLVRVTEGELKADVATLHTDTLTVAVPGATNVGRLIETIAPLGARRVLLAWDADKREDRILNGKHVNHVARGLQMAAIHLSQAGYEIGIEDWDLRYGKGIDDVLASGNENKILRNEGAQAWVFLAELLRSVGQEPAPEVTIKCTGHSYITHTQPQDTKKDETVLPVPAKTDPPPEILEEAPERRVLSRGDDAELAQLLLTDLQKIAGGVVPVYDVGKFWVWKKNVWEPYEQARLLNIIATYAGLPIAGEKKAKPLKITKNLAMGSILFASAACAHDGFFLNAPTGIPFKNGFMQLIDCEVAFKPHAPEYRQRYVLDFDYDPHATAPKWESFMSEVFLCAPSQEDADARKSLLMEGIGASLMGLGPKYQKAFLLLGSGSNGKSTAMKLIKELFPPHVVGSVSPHEFKSPHYRAALATKMVNLVSEIPHKDLHQTPEIKAIITGDEVSSEQKYKDPTTIHSPATHFFAANELPETSDLSDGFFRRFAILLFDRKFKDEEKDEDMPEKLLKDRSGIANLAIKSMLAMVERGHYTMPPSSHECTRKWREDNDQVRRFVSECLTVTIDYDTSIGAIYEAYKKWASAKGVGALSEVKLSNRLQEMGHYHKSKVSRRYNLEVKAEVVKAMEASFRNFRKTMN